MVAVALLGGCASVGPDYAPPPLPARLDARPSSEFVSATSGAVVNTPLPTHWWKLYRDPRLDALVAEGLAANTDLRVAAANLERAQAAVSEARAVAGVQTTADAGVTLGQTSTLGIAPASGVHPVTDLGAGISYQLDVVGRLRRAIEAQVASAAAQAAALDLARTTVAAGIVDAYTAACAAGSQLAVGEQSLRLQRASLALSQRGAAGGIVAPIDVVRSRALVAQLDAALPPLRRARAVSLFRLANLLGRSPDDVPAGPATCATIPMIAQPLPVGNGAELIRRRPDIRQAERELAAATALIGVETAALYPSVTLGASVGTTSRTIGGLFTGSGLNFSLGPLLSWSFPNRSVARARVAQADADARAALARFDGVVLGALREAEVALTTYARDLEENERLRMVRDENRRALSLQRRLRAGGTISGLALLDVERSLASAESTVAASDTRVAADRVTVFLALGGGWER